MGTYGKIHDRSRNAVKHQLRVGAGVIDCDFRDNVGVVLKSRFGPREAGDGEMRQGATGRRQGGDRKTTGWRQKDDRPAAGKRQGSERKRQAGDRKATGEVRQEGDRRATGRRQGGDRETTGKRQETRPSDRISDRKATGRRQEGNRASGDREATGKHGTEATGRRNREGTVATLLRRELAAPNAHEDGNSLTTNAYRNKVCTNPWRLCNSRVPVDCSKNLCATCCRGLGVALLVVSNALAVGHAMPECLSNPMVCHSVGSARRPGHIPTPSHSWTSTCILSHQEVWPFSSS